MFYCLFTCCFSSPLWHDLLKIGVLSERSITAEFLLSHDTPVDIAKSPVDYDHPCGKEVEAVQGEETKARLQGWSAIEAM